MTERSGAPAASAVLNGTGYVTARRSATVSSKITGKVVEVLVEEGQAVDQGQILARLDDARLRAGLALAESELDASRRSLDEIEVLIEQANLTLGRTERLVGDGIAGQADLDDRRAERDALEARLAVAQGQIRVAERQVELRRTELSDTVIVAPFSGVVISKDAQPGEMVSPISAGGGFTRTGLYTLVDMTSLEIEVEVNESYISRVYSGQRVEAVLDAYPDWRIPAGVITTIPAADRQKATVLVRIGFDELDTRILPDMGVKVAFLEQADAADREDPRPRKLIPASALLRDGDRAFAFVVTNGKVERRAVVAGPAGGQEVEIVTGLTAGEEIVVEIPEGLTDGEPVRTR